MPEAARAHLEGLNRLPYLNERLDALETLVLAMCDIASYDMPVEGEAFRAVTAYQAQTAELRARLEKSQGPDDPWVGGVEADIK
jgi:hypothetical protein